MTGHSQCTLFRKLRALFTRATVGIPAASKKKYRMAGEDLLRLRNLVTLFCQVWPTLSARLPAAEGQQTMQDFIGGTSVDEDFYPFLDLRPPKISLSMLRSRREAAKKQEQEKQDLIHSEVAEQRDAVNAAQWSFFQAALKQDQSLLEKMQQVPAVVKSKLHAKTVSKRREQAVAGEKAIKGYQDLGSSF